MSDPATDAELRRARERYRARLQLKLHRLESALERARRPDAGRPDLEGARDLAHQLKGSSGCYGFHSTSVALARIEEGLEVLLGAAPASAPSAFWGMVDRALAETRREVDLLVG